MQYLLKYATMELITYDKDNVANGHNFVGNNANAFEEYNKNQIVQLLFDKDDFEIILDGSTGYAITQQGVEELTDSSYDVAMNNRMALAVNLAFHDLKDKTSWLYQDFYLPMRSETPDLLLEDFAFMLYQNLINICKVTGNPSSAESQKYERKIRHSELFKKAKETKDESLVYYEVLTFEELWSSEPVEKEEIDSVLVRDYDLAGVGQCIDDLYNLKHIYAYRLTEHSFTFDVPAGLNWEVIKKHMQAAHEEFEGLKYPDGCELQYLDLEYAFNYVVSSFYYSLCNVDLSKLNARALNPFYYIWSNN